MSPDKALNLLNEAMKTDEAKTLLTRRWFEENSKSKQYTTGFCYNAAEALFHMIGGIESGYVPYVASYKENDEKCTHWWLQNKEGAKLDPTRSQYGASNPPYHLGKKCGFLTGYRRISSRSQQLMEIALR